MQPRPHQLHCLDSLAKARFAGLEKSLVVMATGLGKTVVAALDAKAFQREYGGRILYLCHQTDILKQARTTFEKVFGPEYTYGYYHGTEKHLHKVDVLFASFQSIASARDQFGPREFNYVVVDEGHHGMAATFRPTIEYFRPKFTLALTATPERGDGQDIELIFGKPVYCMPIGEAIALRLLCDVDYRLLTDEIQNLEVLETPAGKLSLSELNRTLFIPKRDEEIVRQIQEKSAPIVNPRTIIFCSSIGHAEQLLLQMPLATVIHSGLSNRDRKARIEEFRRGIATTVLTVDMFNEGIDVPEANVIVFLRSTASETIFLQQLGRGLRKHNGKTGVLVLDFVANCERIEMVARLTNDIRSARQRTGANSSLDNGPSESTPMLINLDGFVFDEVAKRVLDIVSGIRGGYTREVLIEQLKNLAQQLGRTPGTADVMVASIERRSASGAVFASVFGSHTAAVVAAGLSPNKLRYTPDELIQQLKDAGKELGGTPTTADMGKRSKAGLSASVPMFLKAFGSFADALIAAGFSSKQYSFNREQLVTQLTALASELGRTPTSMDVDGACKVGKCANTSVYARVFGSFPKALEACGMTSKRKRYTQEELIVLVKRLAEELGRTPSVTDVVAASRTGTCASPTAFVKHFGSWNKALCAAGLN